VPNHPPGKESFCIATWDGRVRDHEFGLRVHCVLGEKLIGLHFYDDGSPRTVLLSIEYLPGVRFIVKRRIILRAFCFIILRTQPVSSNEESRKPLGR
jgi:hypothetical protein